MKRRCGGGGVCECVSEVMKSSEGMRRLWKSLRKGARGDLADEREGARGALIR